MIVPYNGRCDGLTPGAARPYPACFDSAVATEGIMRLGLTHLRFAAVALAFATVSLAGPPARAFTMETLGATNPDGSAKFADPDDQVKNFGGGTQPFGPNGPTMQFGGGQGPLGGFRGAPFGAFQGGANAIPPDPYGPRALGNND